MGGDDIVPAGYQLGTSWYQLAPATLPTDHQAIPAKVPLGIPWERSLTAAKLLSTILDGTSAAPWVHDDVCRPLIMCDPKSKIRIPRE